MNNINISLISNKLLLNLLKIGFGVFLGFFLGTGCNSNPVSTITNVIPSTKKNQPVVQNQTIDKELIEGKTDTVFVYIHPPKIEREEVLPPKPIEVKNEERKYSEIIKDQHIEGRLELTTLGKLLDWNFDYTLKTVKIGKTDTLLKTVTNTVMQPKRNLLFIGAGTDINPSNVQSLSAGLAIKTKKDKLVTYNYNLPTNGQEKYHSINFYFPIKLRRN